MPSECMRAVLLRRLRLPLPHAPKQCRCGGTLDPLGDHRAACPVAGVLGPRGAPLERAAAWVCREGGARVATNAFLRDMNVDVPLADSRRIEGLANGLPLWQGAQVAVDTTFVSPVSSAGADRIPGKAAMDARRRKRQTTYPELLAARRCRLVALGGPAAWLPRRRAQRRPASGRQRGRQPATVGRACWRWPRSGPWHGLFWTCHWTWRISAMARNRPWQTCWRTRARPSMCRPLMKRPQPAAQRWGPWNRLDVSSCRRKRPRKKQKNEKDMKHGWP